MANFDWIKFNIYTFRDILHFLWDVYITLKKFKIVQDKLHT